MAICGINLGGFGTGAIVEGNTINLHTNVDDNIRGINYVGWSNGIIQGNSITIDDDEEGLSVRGILVAQDLDGAGGDNNTISGNNVDLTNSRASDIGIYLGANTTANAGSGNQFQGAGVNISDNGAGNSVNISGG